jgi:hypothetical protein
VELAIPLAPSIDGSVAAPSPVFRSAVIATIVLFDSATKAGLSGKETAPTVKGRRNKKEYCVKHEVVEKPYAISPNNSRKQYKTLRGHPNPAM